MKRNTFIKTILLILTPLLLTVSCKEEWDEHYYSGVTERSELNLYDYIKSKPELALFTMMLESTGYDSILSQNQTYTVWAPTNESLIAVNMLDDELVLRTVRNHITRFTIPTSGIINRKLPMLNEKFLHFTRGANGFTLEGKEIIQTDIAVNNGMLHILDEYVPYIYNVWEYLAVADGIDLFRNYIFGLTKLEFDVEKSFVDGVLVDSVFSETNKALTYLAPLNREDTTLTAIFPDNAAWIAHYNKVFPFYKTLEADGGEEAQIENTKWTIVKDLFYRGAVKAPFTNDSIRSTSFTQLTNASEIFPTTEPAVMSNGLSYITSSLNHKPSETWYRKILIEADNTSYGRTSGNYDLTVNPSIGTGFAVSGGSYVNARATSTLSTARLFINFPIPNTLSAKYNVYAVFVPNFITDTTNLKPYKVRFSLNYDYEDGAKRDSIWIGENGFEKTHTKAKLFITEPREMTKVLVLENYEFPWANIYSPADLRRTDFVASNKIRVGLRVENGAGTTIMERLNYSRDIRIDCIILEPVE